MGKSAPYSKIIGADVPQSEALPGQVANSAGGYSFAVDDWKRLERFLILGTEGGTYYAGERKLTLANADVVKRCVVANGTRTLQMIVGVSEAGRAPKNDPALLALALCIKHGDAATRRAALGHIPDVARTGTHLFHLVDHLKAVGSGWGRGTKRAIANWYTNRSLDSLVLQLMKYQQRDGWAHRDVLRKAHVIAPAPKHEALGWAVKGWPSIGHEPHPDPALARLWAFERLKGGGLATSEVADLISRYRLPHECVPNELKSSPVIWESLLPEMGLTALIRNLGKMTSVGLLQLGSLASRVVRDRLGDVEQIKKQRVHPMQFLLALKTYAQGHGDKGKLTWSPVQPIVDALDEGFYKAFATVEPTGKAHFLGVDISGSMDGGRVAGSSLTPREAATAMALVTANVERDYGLYGFSTAARGDYGQAALIDLPFTARTRLDAAVKATQGLPFGGTDCSLPMRHALAHKLIVDVFVVYTDSETWAGPEHPAVSLDKYRQKMGRDAKLVVVGMVANEFTIADPSDSGMLDVVGFDTSTPALLSDFARG